MKTSTNKILITGATGFLGQHLEDELRDSGYKNIEGISSNICDLRIQEDVNNYIFTSNPNIVIHCAATVGGIGANRNNPGQFCYENLIMGANLIEACRKYCEDIKKFVLIGTVCSYGKYTPIPFKEDSLFDGYPEETNAYYGIAKSALMVLLQSYRKQYDFPGITLLPVNMYGECFSSDTNVLTPFGIKNIKDFIIGDKVYTLNPVTHNIEISNVVATQHYQTNEWINFKSYNIDFKVTPNHNMYVCNKHITGQNKNPIDYKKIKAYDFIKYIGRYKQFALAKHNIIDRSYEKKIFSLEPYIDNKHLIYTNQYVVRDYKHSHSKKFPYIYNINDFMEFLGWYISEGSQCKRKFGQIRISQNKEKHPENYQRIFDLLTRMKIPFGNDDQSFYFTSRLFRNYIEKNIGIDSITKSIPKEVFSFGTQQLSILFSSLMKGDGDKNYKKYSTVSRQLMEDIIHLAFLLGYNVNCTSEYPNDHNHNTIYRIHLRPTQKYSTIKSNHISTQNVENEHCYCITTDTNNIIYAGQKNNFNWIGQCDSLNIKTNHVIPAMIIKLLTAKRNNVPEVTLWGTGNPTREFLYVNDCAKAICLAMERYDDEKPVNIGTGKEIKIRDLAELIAQKIEYEGKITWDYVNPDGQPRRCLDVSRAKEFGFEATTSLNDGLDKTIEWIRNEIKI